MLSTKLQKSIRLNRVKSKQPKEEPIDVRQYLFSKMKEEVMTWLGGQVEEITDVVRKVVTNEINVLRKNELKNIKKGDKGDDYVLTQRDKAEIASGIDVPIVEKVIEKTEVVIKEQPVIIDKTITEVIEKAVTDKPEELATKLNTLTQAVEMNVIIGLQEMFANMQRAFNKKGSGATGGGGGKWVHQRWAVSSATTTLALDYNIASDGEAHIFRYNGQVQDLGTDYTVSGKTISLLFTPLDATVASIAYVRT